MNCPEYTNLEQFLINNKYDIIRQLQSGAFAHAYILKHKDTKDEVILKLQKNSTLDDLDLGITAQEQFTYEIDVLQELKDKTFMFGIPTLIECFKLKEGNTMGFTMTRLLGIEYVDLINRVIFPNIIDRSKLLTIELILYTIYYKIFIGLNQLHENGVYHKDLSTSNILIHLKTDFDKITIDNVYDAIQVNIIDFGISCLSSNFDSVFCNKLIPHYTRFTKRNLNSDNKIRKLENRVTDIYTMIDGVIGSVVMILKPYKFKIPKVFINLLEAKKLLVDYDRKSNSEKHRILKDLIQTFDLREINIERDIYSELRNINATGDGEAAAAGAGAGAGDSVERQPTDMASIDSADYYKGGKRKKIRKGTRKQKRKTRKNRK